MTLDNPPFTTKPLGQPEASDQTARPEPAEPAAEPAPPERARRAEGRARAAAKSRPRRTAKTKRAPALAVEKTAAKIAEIETEETSAPAPEGTRRTTPDSLNASLASIYQNEDGAVPNMKEITIKTASPWRRAAQTLLVAGVALSALAWAAWFRGNGPADFAEDRVAIEWEGPTELTFGATTTYRLSWRNQEDVALTNAVLEVTPPENFVFSESSIAPEQPGPLSWRLGTVGASAEGALTITGRLFAPLNQPQAWQASLTFQPENFRSALRQFTTFTSAITRAPWSVRVSGPERSRLSAPATYTFVVTRQTGTAPEAFELSPRWDNHFTLTSSSPALNKQKRWAFAPTSTLSAPNAETKFSLTGSWAEHPDLSGAVQSRLMVFAPGLNKLVPLATTAVTTTLLKNAVTLNLAINGTLDNLLAAPNETLAVTIRLDNGGTQTLSRGQLELVFDAPALKRQSLLRWTDLDDPKDGVVQGEQRGEGRRLGRIIWTKKQLPELGQLKPNKGLALDLRLPLKNTAEADWPSLSTHIITVNATASFTTEAGAPEIVTANPITITLRSDLSFEARHTASPLPEGGAKHDFTWILNNTLRPLQNVAVVANAFGDISFASASPTPAGVVTFDPKEKIIRWSLPEFPEGVDVLALPFSLTLPRANPTQSLLLSKVRVKAFDPATKQTIELTGEETPLAPNP